jgi:hypothetical protein
MANVFAITTATEDIKADLDGKASAVFTVTNTSSKPIRGIANARPLGSTRQDWLSVEGESERDFSANEKQQFTVNFYKAPVTLSAGSPAQPAEKFPFRLDVASAVDSDEVFTEGPQVRIEVAGARPPQEKKPFPWWILIIIGAVAVLAGVVVLVIFLARSPGGGNNNNASPTPLAIVEVKNLYDTAPAAAWKSSNGDSLPYNGSDGDSRGFVKPRDGSTMENGAAAQKILETHPAWVVGGTITGTYNLDAPIKAGDRFRATVGFLQGAGAGNLRLRLLFNNAVVISELPKQYDTSLREWDVDLTSFQGQSGTLSLQVVAIPTSAQGWICWINPRIMNEPR